MFAVGCYGVCVCRVVFVCLFFDRFCVRLRFVIEVCVCRMFVMVLVLVVSCLFVCVCLFLCVFEVCD